MSHDKYEPGDSRRVTLTKESGPLEPPRTGPREDDVREKSEKEESAGGKTLAN